MDEYIKYIKDWSKEILINGQMSNVLVNQLSEHCQRKWEIYFDKQIGKNMLHAYNIFSIFDLIKKIEASPDPIKNKFIKLFKGTLLKGLYHSHHQQAQFIPKNLLTELDRTDMWKEFKERGIDWSEGNDKRLVANKIAHLVTSELYERRSKTGLTGEWLVLARINDINYYLCLGTHNEGDENILKRIQPCLKEFPVIVDLIK